MVTSSVLFFKEMHVKTVYVDEALVVAGCYAELIGS
jgi:hypothetical protein